MGDRRGETVIVAGDFNTAPTEPAFEQLVAGLADAHAEVGLGPGWTWRPSRMEGLGLGVLRSTWPYPARASDPSPSTNDARYPATTASSVRVSRSTSPPELHERDRRHGQIERQACHAIRPDRDGLLGPERLEPVGRSEPLPLRPAVGQSPPPSASQVRTMFECSWSTR